jgi:hypothetical protein
VDTSTPETRRLKEWDERRFVRMSSLALGWIVVLAIIAVMLRLLGEASWLKAIKAETVAQIVPSIVVAIFVFAVGTAFVMVQIVPPARGTRAATTLQGRRIFWTIAPAPGLIIGSSLPYLSPT